MIKQSKLAEPAEQTVARKVAEYLRDCHPGGVILEVDLDGIVMAGSGWRVRVRPSEEPVNRFEYYQALAEVEIELEEREHLNVFLVPSDPKHPQEPTSEAPLIHSSREPKRRRLGTREEVVQKVAEYLRDCHPDGVTLEVDAEQIRKEEYWWQVPVRPDAEPPKLSTYYEALAEVQLALEEREHLKVFLVPSDPRPPEF